jgi:hypothetical protein
VYLVGTGSSGAAATFLTLGCVYTAVILTSAFTYRIPKETWRPVGWTPPVTTGSKLISSNSVHIDTAMKTPQFWMLWTALGCNISAGIGIIGCATTMMKDIFAISLPDIVTTSFCSNYVMMIAVSSIVGRLFWSSMSDYIGRKNMFFMFFGAGIPLYLSVPYAAGLVGSTATGMIPLVMFYSSTMLIFSMYGGGFACIPAYLADLFGTKFVGGIHGRLLTCWSLSGLIGPQVMMQLRTAAENSSIKDLATKVDTNAFEAKFGSPISELEPLMNAKTVTISKLMEIAPFGTIDPTPYLYNNTMLFSASLLTIGIVANKLVKPVDPKFHMKKSDE